MMTSRLIAMLTMTTCLSTGFLCGLMVSPAAAITTHVVNDPQDNPFISLRFFEVGDGPYAYNGRAEQSSTWNLSNIYKNQIIDATGYWSQVIKLMPGENPAIINVGTLNGVSGAAASSHNATMLDGSPTTVQAALTNQYYTNLRYGAHGYIEVYDKVGTKDWSQTPYTPSHITLTAETSLGTVLIHEIGHALGIAANAYAWQNEFGHQVARFDDGLSTGFGTGFNVWSTHLRDDNDNPASAGQEIFCKGCFVNSEENSFDVRKDQAYFTGSHVSEVLDGAMKGLPMRVSTDYGPYDVPLFSHIELKNGLMSHQYYRNYNTLMEAEIAALQDIGYTIDRRDFYGNSVYGDGRTFTNNNPYYARNADGTAYVANTYNTATLGLGLHIYGSHNTVTQGADLLSIGAGGGGVRVDGEGNNLLIAPDVRVYADGENARGIMFTYGKDHTLTHRGDVQALGENGIAVSFDFGHNTRGDATGYRGSYILSMYDSTPEKEALTWSELNGALVSRFDLTGRVAGQKAAIYMSENAYVEQINVMQGAKITGNIISEYKEKDDFNELRMTMLGFGLKADGQGQATYTPDANFNISYADNIIGQNISLQFLGGTSVLTGQHDLYDVIVAQGSTLAGSGEYTIANGGYFTNHGTVYSSQVDGAIIVNGDYKQTETGLLQLAFNNEKQVSQLNVKGNATLSGAIAFTPQRGFYNNGFTLTSDQWLKADKTEGGFTNAWIALASPTFFASLGINGGYSFTVTLGRPADAYSRYAGSDNARHVGKVLDSLVHHPVAELESLFAAFDFSHYSGSTIHATLPQLSGESYASANGVLLNAGAATRTSVNNRLSQAFGSSVVNPVSVLSFASTGKASSTQNTINKHAPQAALTEDFYQYTGWGAVFGSWVSQAGADNVARTKSTLGGFISGIDGIVYDDWRLGVMAGYSRSTFNAAGLRSSGSSDNYTIGTYAGTEWSEGQGAIGLRTGLSYSWHNIEMSRNLAFNGFFDELSADYRAGTFQVFGELGYKHNLSERSVIEPYANLAYMHLKTNGLTEKGYNGGALAVQSGTMNTTLLMLGMRASTNIEFGNIAATARADLGWRHALGDVIPTSTASFAAGSNSFVSAGNSIGKDTALIEAGLDFEITKNTKLGISYQGQFGSGITQNGVNANFNMKF
ncbi:autotransporter outer membrane beta-barrel domain-containing protein [Brucellaceae bacterium C25G]